MQLVSKQLPPNHKIYLISDLHEGATHKHKSGVAKTVEKIANEKDSYVIIGGDIIEGICIDDFRYQSEAVDPSSPVPLLQYKNATKELMPIKGKIISIMDGNHDHKISNKYGNYIKEQMCGDLGAEYGTYTVKVAIKDKDGKTKYKVFYTHGSKSLSSNAKDPIQQAGNMAATVKQRLAPLAGDCLVMAQGHTHKNFVVEPTNALYLTDDGNQITQDYVTNPGNTKFIHPDHRWYCSTGSFLKLHGEMGVSGYAERAGYAPAELGYNVIHVKDYQVTHCEKVVI